VTLFLFVLACTDELSVPLDTAALADSAAPASDAQDLFEETVHPALLASCDSCHGGDRFGFASFTGSADTDYGTALGLISLDDPATSRLLAKLDGTLQHATPDPLDDTSDLQDAVLAWATAEQAARCPDCGLAAPTQYVAYVDAPNTYWALERSPERSDWGVRQGEARILLQPLDPATGQATGTPIDFLDGQLCGDEGTCDFGELAANHAGDQLVFECRVLIDPDDDWVSETSWNLCIAGIDSAGKAVEPRLLRPQADQHRGLWVARSTPMALVDDDGDPLKGVYDKHYQIRRSDDRTPVFSPDDQRVLFASTGPNPQTGLRAAQTYHGTEFVDNVISVDLAGQHAQLVYLNEGGTADHPFFLKSGLVAMHAWNLERMDRHLYIRTTPGGMMETPTLFGRFQGPNMWGPAVELNNGAIVGTTGRRRGAVELFEPFFAEHTLGTGLDEELVSFRLLDPENSTLAEEYAYCDDPPDGENCTVARFYADPAWSPDGRALFALNPETTTVTQGHDLYRDYGTGDTTDEVLASLAPYLPQAMGIWWVDHQGDRERLVDPEPGRMLRYPTWVGRRQAPVIWQESLDPTSDTAELHIAHVPLWLSLRHFTDEQDKSTWFVNLEQITHLRVLAKVLTGNDCMNDDRPYRNAVHDTYDHPTALGINNATGYELLGDVPLEADGSARVTVPAGELLLFQGLDADGHMVFQHSRVFALPGGAVVDTSVKPDQYEAQCQACHGRVTPGDFAGLLQTADFAADPLDFDTLATESVDLANTQRRTMTWLDQLRPLVDTHCVSCHDGDTPAGDLGLGASYSETANYPLTSWEDWLDAELADETPEDARIRGAGFSVSWAYLLHDDNEAYQEDPEYAARMAAQEPLGELAPWDPGYQNLFVNVDGGRYRYLGGDGYASHYGRADRLGGNAQDAFLLEILTGDDLDPDQDFDGLDHTGLLSDDELRTWIGVMDLGFPYMSRCDDATVPSGPWAGEPWGDPVAVPWE